MIRLPNLLTLLIGTSLLWSCEQPIENPNIVFILVDDYGYMDTGYSNPESFYETPNIDKLATTGTVFTNGYAACPVCSPTRASIMTGKYPSRLATTDYFGAAQPENWRRNTLLNPATYNDSLKLGEVTMAEALKEKGYATFFAGKWHLGPEGFWPEDQGFDENQGGWIRGGPYGGNRYFSPYGNPRLSDGEVGEHLPERLARETSDFIRENKEKPFLAFLSFYSVHTPLIGRPDLNKKYMDKRAELDSMATVFEREGGRKVRVRQDHAIYAAMVEAMDEAVGQVMQTLMEEELEDKTIVFFMSDNGGLSTSEGHPTSNIPLRAGKGWLYEGGIRVPWIIKYPGKEPAVVDAPVISTDFLPTILKYTQLDPEDLDGIDLSDLISDPEETPEKYSQRPLFWHYPHYGNQGGSPGSAVRMGKYKLIRWYEKDQEELYDLENDIGESKNLVEDYPQVADSLGRLLTDWLDETGARMPSKNVDYDSTRRRYR